MRIMKGILTVKVIILSIQLAKELFMLELEQSRFNFINGEISQTKLPMSFRFYDPLLIQIKQMLHRTKDQFEHLQNALTEFFGDEIQSKSVMNRLGIEPTYNKGSQNEVVSIDFNDIMNDATALQRSNYISIDRNDANEPQVNYLNALEVNKRQKHNMKVKMAFAAQLSHCKFKKTNLLTMARIREWVMNSLPRAQWEPMILKAEAMLINNLNHRRQKLCNQMRDQTKRSYVDRKKYIDALIKHEIQSIDYSSCSGDHSIRQQLKKIKKHCDHHHDKTVSKVSNMHNSRNIIKNAKSKTP